MITAAVASSLAPVTGSSALPLSGLACLGLGLALGSCSPSAGDGFEALGIKFSISVARASIDSDSGFLAGVG